MLYMLTIAVVSTSFTLHVRELPGWQYFRPILFILFVPLLAKYSVHLVVVPWYKTFNKINQKTKKFQPKVSVVIPAWNEQVGIIGTIESILNSQYKNFEVIVVNDGSTDKTDQIVKNFIRTYNGAVPIKYFKKTNGGKASALTMGIKNADGEIILTTDADCAVDRDAIKNIVRQFASKDVMAVAGNVRVGNNNNIVGAIQKLEYLYGFYFKRADSILNSVYIVGGAAAAYRREIFDILGPFDPDIITEDIEYSTRILNAGYKIRYATDAVFYTEVPSDISSLIKQRLRWKYGRLKTFFKYRTLFFRMNGDHSKFLSFIILPVALFSEVLLFCEVIFLPLFYTYSILSGDFIPLVYTIFILSIIIFLQILTDVKKNENLGVLFWVPVAWLLFYFIDYIEYMALAKSLGNIIKNNNVHWQKWERTGVFGTSEVALVEEV